MLEGKTMETFQEALERLDSVTGIQTIRKKDPFTLTCKFDHGTLESWKVDKEKEELDLNKVLYKGMNLKKFRSSLNSIDQNEELAVFYVMCLRDYEKVDSYYYDTNWIAVDPALPYWINKNGQPEFVIMKRRVNKKALQIILKTKLAFFADDTLYPVLPSAVQVLGTLLDCSAAFRQQDEHQLGNAIMIAEKLSETDNLRILCRERTKGFCPVYSAFGASYQRIEQAEFFDSVMDYLKNFMIFEIDKWKIRSEDSEILLRVLSIDLDALDRCEKECRSMIEPVIQSARKNRKKQLYLRNEPVEYMIRIQTGDMSGKALVVQSLFRYEEAEVMLENNTMKHTSKYYKGGIYKLVSGIGSSILHAYQNLHRLQCCGGIMEYDSFLGSINKIIGKKRTKEAEAAIHWMCSLNSCNALDQYLGMVSSTYRSLPDKQAMMLKKAYKDLLDNYSGKVTEDTHASEKSTAAAGEKNITAAPAIEWAVADEENELSASGDAGKSVAPTRSAI